MIKAKDLIALFERMLREKWTYTWGAAKEGNVDCSGAFVWAFGQFGESIYHGSNTMARKDVSALRPANEARPGWAVFKVRKWTEAESGNRWYGSEPGDVYHVGLMGTDGKVLGAQSTRTGFVESPLDASWDYAAPLDAVEYGEDAPPALYLAAVVTERDPLRVREWPQTGTIIGRVPKGAEVEVLADAGDGWPKIRYNELIGYVSREYLRICNSSPGEEAEDELEIAAGAVIQTVITDEAGNEFRPVGDWSVRIEVEIESD